jgi:hypothetical protein
MSKRFSPRTILLSLLVLLFSGVTCLWYLTMSSQENSPSVDAFIGGATKATVTFAGITIQANDQINQYDSHAQPDLNGPAIAERDCGKSLTTQRYLPWDVLKLSLSGGPSTVCLHEGELGIFDNRVAILVEKVGAVEAIPVGGGSLALSKIQLSAPQTTRHFVLGLIENVLMGVIPVVIGLIISRRPRPPLKRSKLTSNPSLPTGRTFPEGYAKLSLKK